MKTWVITNNSNDYSVAYPGDPYVAYANGWNAGDMASSDWVQAALTVGEDSDPPEMRVTGELTRGSGLPKAAPTIIIGAHYNLE